MSVPETPENPMSSTIPTLRPGDTPVWVVDGEADVFVVGEDGTRFPIAELLVGHAAFPSHDPHQLIVVPRLDCVLSDTAPAGSDPAAALQAFALAVEQRLGMAGSIVGQPDVPAALSAAISAALEADAEERARTFHASLSNTRATYDSTMQRVAYSATTLRNPMVEVGSLPLVAVLTYLGDADGFTVVTPSEEALTKTKDPLRLVAHASGVRYRDVALTSNWQQISTANYLGALIGPDGRPTPVALVRRAGGYTIQGPDDPAPRRLTEEVSQHLAPRAVEFYAPLTPNRAATVRDVLRLGMHNSGALWLLACGMALGIALLGLITPTMTNIVVGAVIPQGQSALLVQIGLALAIAALVAFVFSLVQSFTVSRISQNATLHMQSAFWDRVLSLPASFFRGYSSGDLTVRVLAVDSLSSLVSVQVVSAALAAVFGLVNLCLMFSYDVTLGLAALVVLGVTILVLVLSIRALTRQATEALKYSREGNGWLVQMLSGIMKIRIAHAEDRMEAQYLDIAREQAVAMSKQTLVAGRLNSWFIFVASGASAVFYMVVYYQWEGGTSGITTATYLAFSSAYGLAFAAISGLSSLISPLANAGPTFNLLRPIMEALPETAGAKQDPGQLSGRIELRDIHFRYTPDGPMVLRGLDLTVEPATMVALVGASGAGKSTITRLLLGFDSAERGQVLFDGRDLRDLDATLVRNQMGVVVQNGRITRGSIAKNILGGASQDENLAWEAAYKAAIGEEIESMPMKMQTVIDPGNISGGQAQRILLARALVHNPAILILDEATSALDNASQAHVTEAMNALQATRIVIAHRLSTIMAADSIVVMEKGVAVEAGSYDELMARQGAFYALVRRQTA